MSKLIEHNIKTGEIIERDMNADELSQWESDKAEAEIQAQVEAEAQTAKAALLEKLGITQEEAKLLLS